MITARQLELPNIAHGFFTREGGFSTGIFASMNAGLGSGDDIEAVKKNRAKAALALGVAADHLVSGYQVHGTNVAVVNGPLADRPKVDALVTNTPGLALGVLTADCGPLLFADAEAGVIGAAHAGWKGALNGVWRTTVEAMEKSTCPASASLSSGPPPRNGTCVISTPAFFVNMTIVRCPRLPVPMEP